MTMTTQTWRKQIPLHDLDLWFAVCC